MPDICCVRGSCNPPAITNETKQLSERVVHLSFAPYAKIHRAQQNSQGCLETFQDHGDWQNPARPCLATAFALVEKRQAQTSAQQGRPRRQDGYGAGQGEPPVCLTSDLFDYDSLFRSAIRSVKRPSQLPLGLEPRLSNPERN